MGAAPSTPRLGAAGAPPSPGAAEQMFAALVGDKAYPISSEFWKQLLELPLTLQWPRDRVLQACHAFGECHAPPLSRSAHSLRPGAVLPRAVNFFPLSLVCAGCEPWGQCGSSLYSLVGL